MPLKICFIPDCQTKPDVPLQHLTWAGKYIAEKTPDVVVCAGDFFDMPSLSSYDVGKKSYEGRRYSQDIDAGHRGMDLLLAPIHKAKRYKPKLIFTLGNHCDRITRAIETDAKLEGTISLDDLKLKEYGWKVYPFLKPVKIGGVNFCHYMPSGVMGRPCSTARSIVTKHHMSCVVGHLQGKDIAYGYRGDGRAITAIVCGSFYQHTETYLTPFANRCWQGIVMLHDVKDGAFDEMFVSLSYLKRKYG